jgi:hypothetical protein
MQLSFASDRTLSSRGSVCWAYPCLESSRPARFTCRESSLVAEAPTSPVDRRCQCLLGAFPNLYCSPSEAAAPSCRASARDKLATLQAPLATSLSGIKSIDDSPC